MLLAGNSPKITAYQVQAEHKPRHAEGPFFANLLDAVVHPDPDSDTNQKKRLRLVSKIREAIFLRNRFPKWGRSADGANFWS